MPIVNLTQMLKDARDGGYAVGAFNILDYASMKAVVTAAEKAHAPVIIQTSAKTVIMWGCATMIAWFRDIASVASVPVAIHLDHCKDLDLIRNCIEAGWTSVMIDASSKPYEENLELSRQVVAMAHPRGVSVEAELGEIGGVEDDIAVADEDAHLVDPEKAKRFCAELQLDCFAPAIGTAHGVYKGEPKLAFDRLEQVARETGVPIALHGGTGLSEDVFRKCIGLGAAKVNISTQLKHAFIDSFVRYHTANSAEYNPLKVIGAQMQSVTAAVAENIRIFGSGGKA
jgi:ketose-bisphosphate aldolase